MAKPEEVEGGLGAVAVPHASWLLGSVLLLTACPRLLLSLSRPRRMGLFAREKRCWRCFERRLQGVGLQGVGLESRDPHLSNFVKAASCPGRVAVPLPLLPALPFPSSPAPARSDFFLFAGLVGRNLHLIFKKRTALLRYIIHVYPSSTYSVEFIGF